ncbi:MAG: sulfite exporter TauE/SafE family protein [Candidatus Yanofskybacteria bacterium]|nr:sulfite exporter TauE/SafE family protein [Candidatus Yanofskybacteria bacterium]
MDFSLIIPAFIAGVLTFLAPCTLPLVPGYLGFISGVSTQDLQDPSKAKLARRKIFLNGVLYVLGFSLVFIILGSLFGLGGSALIQYRVWLARIGGIFVIFFGFFMMGVLKLPLLNVEKRVGSIKALKPGNPVSSLVFGAAFAFGWTPCVGPILGSILTLAASSATVGQGAFLLAIFSLGLAVPFLVIAASIGSASAYLAKINKYLNIISVIGGVFLVFIGILLLTNKLGVWISYFYQVFNFINYESLLDYL